jgi:hypothetical protein
MRRQSTISYRKRILLDETPFRISMELAEPPYTLRCFAPATKFTRSSFSLLRRRFIQHSPTYILRFSNFQLCTARATSNSSTPRIPTASVRQTSTCSRP